MASPAVCMHEILYVSLQCFCNLKYELLYLWVWKVGKLQIHFICVLANCETNLQLTSVTTFTEHFDHQPTISQKSGRRSPLTHTGKFLAAL